jgi:hypothetical protein
MTDRLRRTETAALVRLEPDRLRLQSGQGSVADAQQDAEHEGRIDTVAAQGRLRLRVECIEPRFPGADIAAR